MISQTRILLSGAVLATAAAVPVLLGLGRFTSQAVQNPTMSLDMVTSGTTYDETTNTMSVASTENCLTSSPGNTATHLHQAHLVIHDVEDLVGWQVRLNYIGDKMRPQVQNPTPFMDSTTGQNVGFTNLPIDAATQVHRDVTAAQSIPPAPADNTNTPQTALLGGAYIGEPTFAVSPDTPAKPVPDDSSYSAPSGGVLSLINLQVVGNESGEPSLFMNLDDGNPNPVGSKLIVFTGAGTADMDVASSALSDGFHGEGTQCVPLDCVNAECPAAFPTPTPTTSPTVTPRPTPEPGQPWVLTSTDPQKGEQFGRAIAMGDVDGDGVSEIAIGAPLENGETLIDQGRVYIFSGVTGQALRILNSPNPSQSGQFGKTLAMGDLNADGRAEVVVEGDLRVYVFAGDSGSLIRTILPPDGAGTFFGDAMAIGEINGDGNADLAIGAWNVSVGGNTSQGRAYVFSGPTGALLATLDRPAPASGTNFGRSIAIGDVTGDGRGEVLVGAFGEGPLQGRAYLFSGSTYSLIRAIDHPEPQDGARFSEAVAMGDMNNDHLADLALSAPAQEANGVFEAGRVYLFDGPTGVLHNSLQSPDPTPGGEFGAAIATFDMNNDGSAELAIGAPAEVVGSHYRQGRVYLFDGSTRSLIRTLDATVAHVDALFGVSLSLGDTDGNTGPNLVVGAPDNASPAGPDDIGRVYVFCVNSSCATFPTPCPACTPTPTASPTPTATPSPTAMPTPTVTPPPKTIRVPADEPSIQAGIDAALNGDTVLVSPGTYRENINFRGKAIKVIGEQGAARTTIDGGQAGAVVVFDSGEGRSSVLSGFTIRNGLNYFGAGVGLAATSPTITDNVFADNTARVGGDGAGISGGSASPLIERNIFTGHSCDDQSSTGVLTFSNVSSPQILNNVIANNHCRAINMTLFGNSSPSIVNNTILGNRVGILIYSFNASQENYINNVVVQNTVGIDRPAPDPDTHPPRLEHNLVFGNSQNYSGFADPTGVNGNISADPLLVDICHLSRGSPAIDAGDNGAPGLPAEDFDRDDRILDGNGDGRGVADIGADEFTSSQPPANSACTPTPPPKTVRVPADQPTIQRAIDAANELDTVLVSPGTYNETIEYRGKNVIVKSEHGPEVTVIDAQAGGSVVKFVRGEGPDGTLDGFTVRGGSTGGISISESAPLITNNKVINNNGCQGAGIGIGFASPIVRGNVISGNNNAGCTSGIGGGGIFIGGEGKAEIVENIITNNIMAYSCCQSGGGISLWAAGSPVIRGNVISHNQSNSYGGGIDLVNHSDALIVQNLITENSAGLGGGISWSWPPRLINNTIAYNLSGQDSGILADGGNAQALLVNNIIVGDSSRPTILCGDTSGMPVFRSNDVFNFSGPAYGSHCGSPTGLNGNISANPLFADRTTANYHLLAGSPAIDTGDNDTPELPETDFDGDVRILDGNRDGTAVIDMGVDEFVSPPSPTPTPTPTGVHDAAALQISLPNDGGASTPIDVRVQNLGDHSEAIGVYADVMPPGGPSNPYGCTPSGRVLATTVTVAPGKKTTVSSANVSFACADAAGARGKAFTVVAVADAHADDAAYCGPGQLQSMPCYNALAGDDSNPSNNRIARSCCR